MNELTTSLTLRLIVREYFSGIIYDLDHVYNGKKKITPIYFAAHKVRYSSAMWIIRRIWHRISREKSQRKKLPAFPAEKKP